MILQRSSKDASLVAATAQADPSPLQPRGAVFQPKVPREGAESSIRRVFLHARHPVPVYCNTHGAGAG